MTATGFRRASRSTKDAQGVREPGRPFGVRGERHPQVRGGAGNLEASRHDADDQHRLAADGDRAPDDIGRTAEAAVPEAMAQQRHGDAGVGGLEPPSGDRRHAEQRHQVRGHTDDGNRIRQAVLRRHHPRPVVGGELQRGRRP